MDIFAALGFRWDRDAVPKQVPQHSIERATFRMHRMLPQFVWDASALEGNPFTYPEVQTLLDGVTIGGHKISDQEQVLNLAEASRRLLTMVRAGQFELSKAVFTEFNGVIARREAPERGVFRGEGRETNYTPDVGLGQSGRYTPLPTLPGAPQLNRVFLDGTAALKECAPFERATAFFLFGALQQFFFDGNKRTSRFIMNGVLMSNGMDAISVPAAKAQAFNEKMVRFYLSKDASEMMAFLADCHPHVQDLQASRQAPSEADEHIGPAQLVQDLTRPEST